MVVISWKPTTDELCNCALDELCLRPEPFSVPLLCVPKWMTNFPQELGSCSPLAVESPRDGGSGLDLLLLLLLVVVLVGQVSRMQINWATFKP